MNVAIHGNAIAVKERRAPGRPPTALTVTSSAYWSVRRDADGYLWYWFQPPHGRAIPYMPEEVVHFAFGESGGNAWAASPLEALAITLRLEDAAQRTTISSYEQGLRPSGVFVGPAGKENILPTTEIQRMRSEINAEYGGVDNALRYHILQGGMEWKPMQSSFVDGEVIPTRRLTREEVAARYGLPQSSLGILDHATYSNISEQHVQLYQDALAPWFTLIEEELQAQLIDAEPTMVGQYAEFDMNAALRGAMEARTAAYTAATGGPWMAVNEVRARENLPPVEGGDTVRTPLNLAPIDAPPPATAPARA